MTHRDQINNMSNEELVAWAGEKACRKCAYEKIENCVRKSCVNGMIEWLNMEAEEE